MGANVCLPRAVPAVCHACCVPCLLCAMLAALGKHVFATNIAPVSPLKREVIRRRSRDRISGSPRCGVPELNRRDVVERA
ncbi:hypothetical protein Spb1_00380 [Planctopirus ephydatiae]|uniref:Uncharacterized protein n=1 Tax=Planctopirus ephydatiae TaxID=2528019 RepID=A0A518GHU6_9PLAN|nr:hypothetical protein Spb1_00380 [Planctopirus ephydatiae]